MQRISSNSATVVPPSLACLKHKKEAVSYVVSSCQPPNTLRLGCSLCLAELQHDETVRSLLDFCKPFSFQLNDMGRFQALIDLDNLISSIKRSLDQIRELATRDLPFEGMAQQINTYREQFEESILQLKKNQGSVQLDVRLIEQLQRKSSQYQHILVQRFGGQYSYMKRADSILRQLAILLKQRAESPSADVDKISKQLQVIEDEQNVAQLSLSLMVCNQLAIVQVEAARLLRENEDINAQLQRTKQDLEVTKSDFIKMNRKNIELEPEVMNLRIDNERLRSELEPIRSKKSYQPITTENNKVIEDLTTAECITIPTLNKIVVLKDQQISQLRQANEGLSRKLSIQAKEIQEYDALYYRRNENIKCTIQQSSDLIERSQLCIKQLKQLQLTHEQQTAIQSSNWLLTRENLHLKQQLKRITEQPFGTVDTSQNTRAVSYTPEQIKAYNLFSDSRILGAQKEKLLGIFSSLQFRIDSATLVYRADKAYDFSSVMKECQNLKTTLVIAKSSCNTFGGFVNGNVSKASNPKNQIKAFLFELKHQLVFPLRGGAQSIKITKKGILFGDDLKICYPECQSNMAPNKGSYISEQYDAQLFHEQTLFGEARQFQIECFEVFELSVLEDYIPL